MERKDNNIEREKKVVALMIGIYCRGYEKNRTLCADCSALLEYAHKRLDGCKFGENKPNCKNCPIHCYKPQMRQRMKAVMRYAGPRMILHHPIEAIRHYIFKRNTKSDQ